MNAPNNAAKEVSGDKTMEAQQAIQPIKRSRGRPKGGKSKKTWIIINQNDGNDTFEVKAVETRRNTNA